MKYKLTSDFFENEDHALREPNIVLRDSLGSLAIQILSKKFNLAEMEYDVMLCELYSIIKDLHYEYHRKNGHFD